jgi:quinol monooxygenase YgiN
MNKGKFAIIVEYLIAEAHLDDFERHMNQQALDSLSKEPGCLYFDVCQDREDRCRYVLYEVYSTHQHFIEHLETDYFVSFGKVVGPFVKSKSVRELSLL